MNEVAVTAMAHTAEASPDRDLVRSYAREGSEAAFRALVGRHVNLVFAAAFRQAGDTGLAEEITQNVFVALARKAPRLAGYETLAGWLHKTAILCALLAAAPLAWQSRVVAEVQRDQADLTRQVAALSADETAGNAEAASLQGELAKARSDAASARTRIAAAAGRAASGAAATPKPYRWDDQSPLARVPKDMMKRINISGAANRRGELTPEIKAALQLTEVETTAVQSAIDRLVAGYQRTLAKLSHRVDPASDDLQGHPPEDVRVFQVEGLREPAGRLKTAFLADLAAVLDEERLDLLKRSLDDWMPLDEERHGLNTSTTIYDRDHRVRFFHLGDAASPVPDPVIGYGIVIPGYGSFTATINASEIPEFMRPSVQEWIDAVRKRAAEAPVAPGNPSKHSTSNVEGVPE